MNFTGQKLALFFPMNQMIASSLEPNPIYQTYVSPALPERAIAEFMSKILFGFLYAIVN
jgi:hypothetical protein